jgi:peptide/nickel transport system permease protein
MRYLVRRIATFIPLVFGIWTIVFLLIQLVPGDAVDAILGTDAPPGVAKQLRQNLQLDRPLWVRYATSLGRLANGDLGASLITGRPVRADVLERVPVTLELAIAAIIVFMLVGLPLGIVAAVRQNSVVDYLARLLSVLGLSVPNFWLALLLVLTVALRLRLLPSQGYVPLRENPLLNLRQVVLPAIALGGAMAAVIARMTRSALLDVLRQDYIRTARAKGVSPRIQLSHHALRNAFLPILTVAGLQVSGLLGGTVIVESIFAWPGIGSMILNAIYQRDLPTLQAGVVLVVVAVALVNLLVDLAYAWFDPRIRYE